MADFLALVYLPDHVHRFIIDIRVNTTYLWPAFHTHSSTTVTRCPRQRQDRSCIHARARTAQQVTSARISGPSARARHKISTGLSGEVGADSRNAKRVE
jgi:hypothetical protein